MSLTLEAHLTFWRTLANDLKSGRTLLSALEHAKEKLQKTELGAVAERLIQEIAAGNPLSDAMAPHGGAFSGCMRLMVRAGEAGGVLDVIAERLVEGLQDGSVPIPGAQGEDNLARYCRAFARLISSGVPILQAIELIGAEVAGPQLKRATTVIHDAIREGSDITSVIETMPETFPKEVRVAVEEGERKGNLDERLFRIADALEAGDLDSLGADVETLQSLDAAPPVVKFVNLAIIEAVKQRASDIHIDPTENGRGRIRLRVDGVLRDAEPPPPGLHAKIISHIKIMACMDIAERRLPQDGRIAVVVNDKSLDLRVSVVPTALGERAVVRILDRECIRLDLERIGFLDDELATVRSLCHLPNGILICNGPTGSGKTTLLYAMLNEVDRDRCCVMSVEDPVEYRLDRVAQVQVEPRRGFTHARALRSILRQDPDVIMVGEVCDLETLQAIVQCALTGHLLLTTLHSNTSPEAIRRLIDVGLEPCRANASLAGVISQRLVRVLCPQCKQAAEPPVHSMPPEATEFLQRNGVKTIYGPKGCEACKGTGYRGRTAIHEILVPDDRVRGAVAASADVAAIRNAALAAGMKPLLISGLERVARCITSIQEVCRVIL